ncbi:MAG: response regulator transcription factor [Crocinitomicaceae bacterium]|nr:response regulator transcription factor [Crocinitomicaceae bacterium]
MKAKILLVEDDVNLGFIISDHLSTQGYEVSLCTNGVDALVSFNQNEFHLCVFDIMMPLKDGFTLAKDVRKTDQKTPILFLTAKTMTKDRIEGFKSGGDDYLTKPFSMEEFSYRIKSLLKRVEVTPEKAEALIKIGTYFFHVDSYLLQNKSFEKKLTKKEAQILRILCKNIGQVTPREIILNAVWGQDDYFTGRSMDVFITKLRKYLKEDDSVKIENIHGIGFKLSIIK